jgi:hypothetical protein
MSWRIALGLGFFAAQLVYLWPSTWAPFHEHAVYRLSVNGLNTKDSLAHYRLPAFHYSPERDENWETNDLRFVVRIIEASPPATVHLEGTVNGTPFTREWPP